MNKADWHTFVETAGTDPANLEILRSGDAKQITALAAEKGYHFSEADVEEASGELTESVLASVAGGFRAFI